MITDHSYNFWVLGWNDNYNWHLRVYSVNCKCSDSNLILRDISVTTTDGKHVDLMGSCLLYSSNMNIFLNENNNTAVHVFSAISQNHCQLLSPHHLKNEPCVLVVDKRRQLLYVGQEKGVV